MWKLVGVLGVGGRGRKKEKELESSSASDSESSWHSAEAEADELENFYRPMESNSEISTTFDFLPDYSALKGLPTNYYGPNESDSAASTSYRYSPGNSRAKGYRKRNILGSNSNSIPSIKGYSLDSAVPRVRELRVVDEPFVQADRLQSSRSSRRVAEERLRGGYEVPRAQSDEPPSLRIQDLKKVQLQKLQRLEQIDRDWSYLLPRKVEKKFSWPWKTLTEQQVALGQLEFKRFIVVLSCCQEWQLQPEHVLTMEQIQTLHQVPLEEIVNYLNHEIAISKGVQNDRVSHIKKTWLKKDRPIAYECHVDKNGASTIKIVQPKQTSTLLHRTFGEDRIMPVFVNEEPDDPTFAQTGICVGLRRYRLWTYKNSGKDDFQKWNEAKDVDIDDPNFKYFAHIHSARCLIMHIDAAPTMASYALRLQLALSKSISAEIDLQKMDEIKEIADIYCKTLGDSGKPMSHTDGTGEISSEVAKMLPASVFKGKVDDQEGYPTLVQIRMFWEGMAIKGTFQVNHTLVGKRIYYRRSMVKVERSNELRGFQSVNTLEVVTTCRKPKEANLSQDLIVLLTLGKVPPTFFLKLLKIALDNVQNIFTNRKLALKEVEGSTAESGLRDQTLRMLKAGLPMTNTHMQRNLRSITQDKLKGLRRGCVPLPDSCYLMGTCDPTPERILKRNQVAIPMGDGKKIGKVLVYKNPGKHWGDVHIFDAVWDERLDPYVGRSKFTIFFSTNGDRPIVDEIANSDLDGDMYWVCDNTELISLFKPLAPWQRPSWTGIKINTENPSKLSATDIEVCLFDRFLKARFANGKYPPTMPLAATYWLAHMDQYLLRDAVQPALELGIVKKKIDELINIFYKALDSEKAGEEVALPWDLVPKTWPHHMKKETSKPRKYYKSTSILGQLHDMACVDAKEFGHQHEDTMQYDPKFQYGEFEMYREKWQTLFKQYNKEMRESSPEIRGHVIVKYQQILKGERKSLHQIWEEASMLYHINYEHARGYLGSKFSPSMVCAFAIAGTYLCDIYTRKEENEPFRTLNKVKVAVQHMRKAIQMKVHLSPWILTLSSVLRPLDAPVVLDAQELVLELILFDDGDKDCFHEMRGAVRPPSSTYSGSCVAGGTSSNCNFFIHD